MSRSKVISFKLLSSHTHRTDRSTCTTKMVGDKYKTVAAFYLYLQSSSAEAEYAPYVHPQTVAIAETLLQLVSML